VSDFSQKIERGGMLCSEGCFLGKNEQRSDQRSRCKKKFFFFFSHVSRASVSLQLTGRHHPIHAARDAGIKQDHYYLKYYKNDNGLRPFGKPPNVLHITYSGRVAGALKGLSVTFLLFLINNKLVLRIQTNNLFE
jgi:hypothetical protein